MAGNRAESDGTSDLVGNWWVVAGSEGDVRLPSAAPCVETPRASAGEAGSDASATLGWRLLSGASFVTSPVFGDCASAANIRRRTRGVWGAPGTDVSDIVDGVDDGGSALAPGAPGPTTACPPGGSSALAGRASESTPTLAKASTCGNSAAVLACAADAGLGPVALAPGESAVAPVDPLPIASVRQPIWDDTPGNPAVHQSGTAEASVAAVSSPAFAGGNASGQPSRAASVRVLDASPVVCGSGVDGPWAIVRTAAGTAASGESPRSASCATSCANRSLGGASPAGVTPPTTGSDRLMVSQVTVSCACADYCLRFSVSTSSWSVVVMLLAFA
jgi:hypothetical protein